MKKSDLRQLIIREVKAIINEDTASIQNLARSLKSHAKSMAKMYNLNVEPAVKIEGSKIIIDLGDLKPDFIGNKIITRKELDKIILASGVSLLKLKGDSPLSDNFMVYVDDKNKFVDYLTKNQYKHKQTKTGDAVLVAKKRVY